MGESEGGGAGADAEGSCVLKRGGGGGRRWFSGVRIWRGGHCGVGGERKGRKDGMKERNWLVGIIPFEKGGMESRDADCCYTTLNQEIIFIWSI